MSTICLFGALCAVNQSVLNSNSGLDLFDPSIKSEVNSTYITNDQSPSESPCPSIFQYIKEAGEWHGEMTLEHVDLQEDINLRLEIIVDKNWVGKHVGELDLTHKESSNQTIVYKVLFSTQNPVPKVKGIYYNGQLICSGPEDAGAGASTTIKLRNIVKSGRSDLPTNKFKREIIDDCESSALRMGLSLSIGGEEVPRGEFPWLVAFYGLIRGETAFICGGNLISNKIIITAAHCIQDKQVTKMRQTQDSYVYLGKHNLNDTDESGFEERGVERFIVHPKWKPFNKSYDADIAIIVMDSPVEYSKYIRPICMWEFSDNSYDVVGQQGRMAGLYNDTILTTISLHDISLIQGWGLNENFVVNSEYPKMIVAKIINDGTCFRKSPALVPISSDTTFCATGAKDEGPCQGDSGGGLILKKENKWYLRGLVSASERSKNGNVCEPGSLVVFTDVTKFISWIQSVEIDKKTDIVSKRIAVTRGQYPWIAAFYVVGEDYLSFKCCGSLISKVHVITTISNCVQKSDYKKYYKPSESLVYLGKHNLNDLDEPGYERRGVRRFIFHPEWKPLLGNYEANIAIIIMDSPVKYSQFIQPISIWEFSDDLSDNVGESGIITGWGFTEDFPETSELTIQNYERCIEDFTDLAEMSSVRRFCAGGEKDEHACICDYGSGLAMEVNDKWYLRGMFARAIFINESCVPDAVGLFTDVAKFVSWIASNTGA